MAKNKTNNPPRCDRWRGPTFDVTLATGSTCSACGARHRPCHVTQCEGVTRMTCWNCHAIEWQVEQHAVQHDVEAAS